MEILYNVIRIVLGALALWHLFRKTWKPLASLAIVFALTYLPMVLDRWLEIRLDSLGRVLYIVVLCMAMYLGTALKFYDKFVWWDRITHLLSGILFVNFGIAIVRNIQIIPPFTAILFAFCFSLAMHYIWELLEYASDCFGRSDNQRWQKKNPDINHQPVAAKQPPGLVDTMNDMIMGLIGAIAAGIVWYIIG